MWMFSTIRGSVRERSRWKEGIEAALFFLSTGETQYYVEHFIELSSPYDMHRGGDNRDGDQSTCINFQQTGGVLLDSGNWPKYSSVSGRGKFLDGIRDLTKWDSPNSWHRMRYIGRIAPDPPYKLGPPELVCKLPSPSWKYAPPSLSISTANRDFKIQGRNDNKNFA